MISNIYLCSFAEDCVSYAEKYGLGIEIDEFCTAVNMDNLQEWGKKVQKYFTNVKNFSMHAPFNDLVPVSIDNKIRQVTKERYLQFFELAHNLNVKKLNFHSGFIPYCTFEEWYFNELAEFWQPLAKQFSDFDIYIENTFEPTPDSLKGLVDSVNLNNFSLCLDIGHAHCISKVPVVEWIKTWGERLKHMHLHNNKGIADDHLPLQEGELDVLFVLNSLKHSVSATIECDKLLSSIEFLLEHKASLGLK